MATENALSARMAFSLIDDATIAALRSAKDVILGELRTVLDRFYVHILQFPETKAMFRDSGRVGHAKDMQLQHWSVILDGKFDHSYESSIRKVGEVHNRIGLEPRLYIGGYSFMISNLVEAVGVKLGKNGWRNRGPNPADVQKAIIKVGLLDMDLAITSYLAMGTPDRRAAIDRLAAQFDGVVSSVISRISATATNLQAVAHDMKESAGSTQAQTRAVTKAAEQASANVRSVATAAEELSASVKEISRQTVTSSSISQQAVQSAEHTRTTVGDLASAANKIGAIIDLIRGIAGQTNLLALNATIEAARAGEAGRGFAVVAQEVKALAEQTAKATAEIGTQIEEIQTSTSNSAADISKISDIIRSMNEVALTIAAAVDQQGSVTAEITRSAHEAALGTNNVSSNISGVNDAATKTETTATEVLSSAQSLTTQAEQLQKAARDFIGSLRAA
jgi:methyl-accepting chemotaxis protein